MKDMTDNELIAEFMGLHKDAVGLYLIMDAPPDETPKLFSSDNLKFHTSWDWLMPVVEKISNLGEDDFYNEEAGKVCTRQVCNSIETVYGYVVEFIKWYNKEKNNLKE